MKRTGNLFAQIWDIDNLRLAHKNAKKGKGWYKEIIEIDKNPNHHLFLLQFLIRNHLFKTSCYEMFYKKEHNKIRTIYKLPYYP